MSGSSAIIELTGVIAAYDGGRVPVLDIPGWRVDAGEQVVLEGPSGCGKTTLVNILAAMRRPDAGRAVVCGADLATLDEAAADRWRGDHVGIVFQSLNLLQGFTALENVLLGLSFTRSRAGAAEARERLAEVGLGHRLHHQPAELSLGEQQRVAIARALVKRPALLLADEPTGSLDPRNAAEVAGLLAQVCRDHGCTLVMVCHQPEIAARFPRRVDVRSLNRAGGGA